MAARRLFTLAASIAALLLSNLWVHEPLLCCMDTHIIDHAARLPDDPWRRLLNFDTRLNAWILAWVQRSLLTSPSTLFDSNTFYPATGALAGSEHLISAAIAAFPARLWWDSAVALHQWTIVFSGAMLALSTFGLAYGATGSALLSVAAGAVAVTMPWRLTETGHVQLLSCYCMPAIWWCLVRWTSGFRRVSTVSILTLLLTFQLLASFYLAYFTLASVTIVLLAARIAWWRPSRKDLALLVPFGIAGIALLLVSLPYLEAKAAQELTEHSLLELSPGFEQSWRWIGGPLASTGPEGSRPTYFIPTGVLALTLLAGFSAWPARSHPGSQDSRRIVLAMLSIVLLGLVMMLGRSIEIGGTRLYLPYELPYRIVPGFSSLRGTVRWSLLASLAAPIAAAAGIHLVAQRFTGFARATAIVLGCFVLVAGTQKPDLPIKRALDPRDEAAYEVLARLPEAPVLEIPWELPPGTLADNVYTLASTLHWKPLLNGYTGYPPRSYFFLNEIAQQLPGADMLRTLNRLTGVKWFVVHKSTVWPPALEAWSTSSELQLLYEDERTRIYDYPQGSSNGDLKETFRARGHRTATLIGTPRIPLDFSKTAGVLSVAFPLEAAIPAGAHGRRIVSYSVTNTGETTWPAFDVQSDNLVRLQIEFSCEPPATTGASYLVSLPRDLAPSESITAQFHLVPPTAGGKCQLTVGVVQSIGDNHQPLPVPPFLASIELLSQSDGR